MLPEKHVKIKEADVLGFYLKRRLQIRRGAMRRSKDFHAEFAWKYTTQPPGIYKKYKIPSGRLLAVLAIDAIMRSTCHVL